MPVNIIYPLITKKGQPIRFNTFNFHPDADFCFSSPSDFQTDLGISPDYYTSEFIYTPHDTGYFFLVSEASMVAGAYYTTNSFYTLYVASDTVDIPEGYFLYKGIDYQDKFLSVYPDSPSGKIDLVYMFSSADSVKFDLLPINKPYPGFSLKTESLSNGMSSLGLQWNDKAFMHTISGPHKGFINILVSKYKAGKPYYETFTVAFNSDTTSSVHLPGNKQPRIYPNPVSQNTFKIDLPSVGSWTYLLSDLAGRTLQTGSVDMNNPIVSVSGIPCGMYLIKVSNGVKSYSSKIFRIR
jgi:hypothetical protein